MFSSMRRPLHWSIFGLLIATLIAIASVLSSPTHAAPLREPVINSGPAGPATEPDRVERVGSHHADAAPQAAYPGQTLYSYAFFPARNGAVHFIYYDADVHADSIISASITEVDGDDNPLFGAAQLNVANVTASEGVVNMYVNIGWDSALPSRVSLEIMQP